MDKVLVLIAVDKDIVMDLVKLIQDMLPGLRIVLLYDDIHKLEYYLEKTSLVSADTAVVNIRCTNPLALDMNLPQNFYVFNFCFNCCKENHNKRILCVPPYITLARVLVNRIKMLFENLDELKVSIRLSIQEIALLMELLATEQSLLSRSISSCLSEEESYYSMILPAENTSITITAIGNIRGYKEKTQLNVQYTVYDKSKCISSLFAQAISILTLWLYCIEHAKNCADITTRIGYEEGLYTLYISKLVECGADFVVKLSFEK